jgi:hypothetical protein
VRLRRGKERRENGHRYAYMQTNRQKDRQTNQPNRIFHSFTPPPDGSEGEGERSPLHENRICPSLTPPSERLKEKGERKREKGREDGFGKAGTRGEVEGERGRERVKQVSRRARCVHLHAARAICFYHTFAREIR